MLLKRLQSTYGYNADLNIRVHNRKIFFVFLNQNICCGYSKEPSQSLNEAVLLSTQNNAKNYE